MAQISPTTNLSPKPPQSFHKSIKPFAIIANCFGLLPVDGVTANSIEDLTFRWISLKTFHSFFFGLQAICGIVLNVIVLFRESASGSTMLGLCFYCFWLMQLAAYFYLARKWPELMKKWYEIDLSIRRVYGYPSSLDIRIRFTAIVIFVAATLYLVLTFHSTDQLVSESLENIYVIIGTQCIHPLVIRGFIMVHFIVLSYIWILNDLFVILISTALALRFKQVTDRVLIYGTNTQSLDFWSEIRTDYIRLFELCQLINECCPFQITLSFATDIWYILLDIFMIIRYNETEQSICFIDFMWCSLLIVCTILHTAWVNDESKRFAAAVNYVPSRNHNFVIQLLQEQVPLNPVALSGNNIFWCTRGLILNIIGAVITYEILLIQFCDIVFSR